MQSKLHPLFNKYSHLVPQTLRRLTVPIQHDVESAANTGRLWLNTGLWSYNPNKGVTIETHLINHIRWGLQKHFRKYGIVSQKEKNSLHIRGKTNLESVCVASTQSNDLMDTVKGDTGDATDAVDWSDFVESVLSASEYETWVLVKDRGLSHAECAVIMLTTTPTIQGRIARSCRKLQKAYLEVKGIGTDVG